MTLCRPLACAVCLAALALPATASAKPLARGKIPRASGFTVLALGADGKATYGGVGRDGGLTMYLPARGKRVSLQLIDRKGSYYGPIVLRVKGRKAYTSLRRSRSVKLGKIKLRRGYALVKRALAKRLLDRHTARAKAGGRPVGSGLLGLVAKGGKASAAGLA